jgi:hypothetical protein
MGTLETDDPIWSEMVKVPVEYVEESKESHQELTIGDIFNREYGWPSGSWHKLLGGKERWEIISSVAATAFDRTF